MDTPELQHRIAQWRAQALAGTLSIEDLKSAIIVMRESRRTAEPTAKAVSRRKAPANADTLLRVRALLDELEGL